MIAIEASHRVNWWQVITDLMLHADMTQDEIGRACGCEYNGAKAWVNALRNEVHQEPKFRRGLLLVQLWEARVADVQGFDLSRVLVKDI